MQFSKTSPLKSGESSEKSSGENRVKSCHVCGCHAFFGPEECNQYVRFRGREFLGWGSESGSDWRIQGRTSEEHLLLRCPCSLVDRRRADLVNVLAYSPNRLKPTYDGDTNQFCQGRLSAEVLEISGKRHPWTNTSLGGNFRRTFRAIGPYIVSLKARHQGIGPYEFPMKLKMDQWLPNFSESSGPHRCRSVDCSSLAFAPPAHEFGMEFWDTNS